MWVFLFESLPMHILVLCRTLTPACLWTGLTNNFWAYRCMIPWAKYTTLAYDNPIHRSIYKFSIRVSPYMFRYLQLREDVERPDLLFHKDDLRVQWDLRCFVSQTLSLHSWLTFFTLFRQRRRLSTHSPRTDFHRKFLVDVRCSDKDCCGSTGWIEKSRTTYVTFNSKNALLYL